MKLVILFFTCLTLTGCGVAAAPCRVTSGLVSAIPVIGHLASAPTDGCAKVID